MAYEVEKRQDHAPDDADALSMACTFSIPITVVDSNGQRHNFRKFEWLGRWGICNADKTKIIVKAKSNYLYVEVLIYAQVLVAGDRHCGWDVYSLTGEFLRHYPKMYLSRLTRHLDSKKRNS